MTNKENTGVWRLPQSLDPQNPIKTFLKVMLALLLGVLELLIYEKESIVRSEICSKGPSQMVV